MNNHKRAFLASTAALLLAGASLFGQESYLMEVRIKGIEKAGPPRYLERQVLLSYQSDRPVRLVGARFAYEQYRVFHVYFRNENNVFLLLLDVPEEVAQLRYRIVVDGLWMSDPFNPETESDSLGRSFSIFDLRDRPPPEEVSPQIHPEGTVTFFFHTLSDRAVSVAGDFNNWDPFWNRLKETEPGSYSVTVRMPAGRHYYYYLVNGQRVLDPLNQATARDYEGYRVSTFFLPSPRPR